MNDALTVEGNLRLKRCRRDSSGVPFAVPEGTRPVLERPRVSRVARLMALALRFEMLVQSGAVSDYAELARLGRVSRARVSQVMNLLQLAPDLQERVLFLTRPECGRDPVHLARLLPIAAELNWRKQRRLWRQRIGM